MVLVFFVTYVLCQPPATVLLRKLGPRNFLATITLFWGAVMIVSGYFRLVQIIELTLYSLSVLLRTGLPFWVFAFYLVF